MSKTLKLCLFSFFEKISQSVVNETIGHPKIFTKYDL